MNPRDVSRSRPEALELLEPEEMIPASIWSWPEASPGQRAAAFVLDSMILAAVFALVRVMALNFLDVAVSESATLALTVVYWIALQHRAGQTLGKKFMGIRVLPLEPGRDGDRVPLARLIVRETVGRGLCILLLGFGFLRILFRRDRMGLHDTLARTRVVSLSEGHSFPVQTRFVLGGLAALAIVVMLAIEVVVRFTSYPMREVARRLEADGYVFGRIEGSIASGFRIDHVGYVQDHIEVEIEGLRFDVDDAKRSREGESALVLRALSAEAVTINVLKWEAEAPRDPLTQVSGGERTGPFATDRYERARASFGPFEMGVVDLAEVQVRLPGQKPLKFKRVYLNDIVFAAKARTFTMGRIWADGDAFLIDGENLLLQRRRISAAEPVHLQIKPAFDPELLSAPIDVHVSGLIEDFKPLELRLTAFARKLRFDWNGSSGELRVSDFTPLHFLRTQAPFWNLDLGIAFDANGPRFEQMRGTAGLRGVRFETETSRWVQGKTGKGRRQFVIAPRAKIDWRAVFSGREAGFTLGSSDRLPAREALAQIYYAKSLARLSAHERQLVETDARFFVDTVDASAPPAVIMAAKKSEAPSIRSPSSVQRKTKGTIPTKLPPFKKRRR